MSNPDPHRVAITRERSAAYLSGMAMTWDAVLVSALAEELHALLRGARLRAHAFRWEDRELVLVFREGILRWYLHPRKGWLSFDPPGDEPADARPLAARVLAVRSFPDERLLEIGLRRDRGRHRTFRVVLELMTNQWNALLLEGEAGWIRHLLWTRRLEERTLAIGHAYSPPPPSTRKGIETPLTPPEWGALLAGSTPEAARATLLKEIAFTSPINISSILNARNDGDPEDAEEGSRRPLTNPADGTGKEILPPGLRQWVALRGDSPGTPCVLESGEDKQPYPYILKEFRHTEFPNLITAIQAVAREAKGELDPGEEALETLERALHQARRRARGIRKELDHSADPEEPRGRANLLLARLGEVPRGAESVTLQGFQGEEVVIHLDPAESPQENARILYQEAARRERARARLPILLREADEEVLVLKDLRRRLAEGSLTPEEAAARAPPSAMNRPRDRKQGLRTPFRRYFSSGGLEIRVGRSAKENDTLTFRESHPEDVWLHARDRAGAHVILRWRKEGSPPQKDLTEAAVLAALHSGARTAGAVPVDWTRRKYVRKPRNAPPGSVVVQRARTLFVEPDPELPKRLGKEPSGDEGRAGSPGRD